MIRPERKTFTWFTPCDYAIIWDMDFDRIAPDDDEEQDLRKRTGCFGTTVKILLALLIPLAIAFALLPKAFTSASGRQKILAYVNKRIAPSTFTCSSLEVGWFTPLEIKDAALALPRDGIRITCPKLTSDRFFFQVFPIGRLNLGHLQLTRPECVIAFPDPDALAAESGDGLILPVADLAGRGTIEDGTLIWSRATDGQQAIPFTHLNASIDMPSFWKPFHFRGTAQAGGGQLSAEGDLKSLKDFAEENPDSETEQTLAFSLKQVDASALRPFVEPFAGVPMRMEGLAHGDFNLRMSGTNDCSGKSTLTLTRFSVQTGDHQPSPPATVDLNADFSIDAQAIRFSPLTLESPWLAVRLEGALTKNDTGFNRTGKLGGRATLKLPELIKDFGAVWDIPATLNVESGAIDLQGDLVSDDETCSVNVKAVADALAWSSPAGRVVPRQQPVMTFRASIPHDKSHLPEVSAFSFKSAFAELSGKGPLDALTVTGNMDLGRFHTDYHTLFPNSPALSGSLFLHAGTQRQGERMNLAVLMKAKAFTVTPAPDRQLSIPQGSLTLKGSTPFQANGALKREFNEGAFELKVPSGILSGGWQRLAWDDASVLTLLRGFKINTKVPVAEWANLLGGALAPETRKRLLTAQGDLLLNGTAEISGGQAKALFNGLLQTVTIPTVNGVWSIPDLRFESRLSQGTAGNDLLRTDTIFSGIGSFSRSEVKVFTEKKGWARLTIDIPPDGKAFPLKTFAYRGVLGECELSGQIADPFNTCLVNIAGTWAPDFTAITRLLNTQAINGFFLSGRTKRKIQLQAPLGCGLDTFLLNGKGKGSVHLQSAEGFGLYAGASEIACTLEKGNLALSYTPQLNNGKLNLAPTLSRTADTTLFKLPERTRVLDRVNLTQPMLDQVLANVTPLFAGCKIKRGNISLDVHQLEADLHQPPERQLNAKLNLYMKDVELEMGPNLRKMIPKLFIKDDIYRSQSLMIPITVKSGNVSVDTATFIQQFLLDSATSGKNIESDPGFLDQIKMELSR